MHEPRLAWPPPGLESLHGRLWPLINLLALADLVLLLPLLPAAATHQPFWSLGPFGTHWWILLTTTAIGLVLFVTALFGLIRLCWAAAHAARHGHGWQLIIYVAADESRDGGFLLQGARAFADVPVAQRRTVLALRMTAAAAWLAAAVLAPLGLTLAILLAAAGWAGEATMWVLTLGIPMALLLAGVACRIADRVLTAAAWRAGKLTVTAEMRAEIGHWTERFGQHPAVGQVGLGAPGRSRAFRTAAVTAAILGALVAVAMALTTAAGAVGAILASVSVPSYSNLHARIAAADVMRRYRLDPDPAISAQAAGEALHALLAAGQSREDRFAPERAPVRGYQTAWLPEPVPALANQHEWLLGLFDRARRLSPSERAYLQTVAANPAHGEFTTIARARAADIIGTRYQLPLPDTLAPVALPIPRYGRVREGARAHLATAALALADGRVAQAEQRVREVISMGFVLMDQGPTLIDNMIGATLIGNGADALERLFHATGRGHDADELAFVRATVKKATDRTAQGAAAGIEEALSAMPRIVVDTTMAMGLRWEFLTQVATFASCINLHRMIFGAKEDYAQWLDQARRSLVRRPSDEEMFRFMARGFFGSEGCLPMLGAFRSMNALN
jgi:hypothetical protein